MSLLWLAGCQRPHSIAEQPEGTVLLEATTGADLAEYTPLADRIPALSEDFYSREGRFVCSFPFEPVQEANLIATKRGEIEVTTFTCEYSTTKVYLISYSDHPSGLLLDAPARQILRDARLGIIENLGPETKASVARPKSKGVFEGIAFEVVSGAYNANYELYLAGNRLYEIAILKDGAEIAAAEMELFSENFDIVLPERES